MKILISEGMVEVEENAVKDIQIGGVWSFCKECGHFASDCSQYKFEGKNVNFAKEESDSEDPALLLACGKFDGSNSNTWYLDTRVSNHMCGIKEAFVYIQPLFINY